MCQQNDVEFADDKESLTERSVKVRCNALSRSMQLEALMLASPADAALDKGGILT